MKGKLRYQVDGRTVERDINYIPVGFIFAILFAVLETVAVIAAVMVLRTFKSYKNTRYGKDYAI